MSDPAATVTLASGNRMPAVGLGFWKIEPALAAGVVRQAVTAGYRHLDCASDYGNEADVGRGIDDVLHSRLISRDELWITSKLWNTCHRAEHVLPAVRRTLSDLRVDYLDLYLIHFPISLQHVPFEQRYPAGWFFDPAALPPKMHYDPVPVLETWQAMEELTQRGLVREIGVSNFNIALLRDLLATQTTRPAVLQVELHPFLTQDKLLRFCQEQQIAVTGFSPLGAQSYFQLNMAQQEESLLAHPALAGIAAAHGKTPAQVALRWAVQRGTSIVPKSTQTARLVENLAIFDFELTAAEMRQISGLNRNRRFNDPGDFCEAAFNTFFPIYE